MKSLSNAGSPVTFVGVASYIVRRKRCRVHVGITAEELVSIGLRDLPKSADQISITLKRDPKPQ